MTRLEADVLVWLSDEQRPVSQLLAMRIETLSRWIRARGGKLQHIDAAYRIRMALSARLREKLMDAPNVSRLRAVR
jgi:hypothetical protein